jgi:uncharacterized membrane protein YjfL (UPF0719 family)
VWVNLIDVAWANDLARISMDIALIGLALLRLILAIIFAIVGLYIASWVLGRLTKAIDEWKEIERGNHAVAIYVAGIFISVAIIVGPGVIGLFRTFDLIGIVVGFVQLLLALALAVVMQYIGLSVFGRLTKELDEWAELKKGNDAVGIVMAAIVIAISTIVSQGVSSIIAAIFA